MAFQFVLKQQLAFALMAYIAMTTTVNNSGSFVSASSAISPTAGAPSGNLKVGIIRLDGWGNEITTGTGEDTYVPIRGDVDDGRSYEDDKFGLVATVAKGCTWESLQNKDLWEQQQHLDDVRDNVAKSFRTLMEDGVDVIIANCGLFMWLHSKGIATPAMDMALKSMGGRATTRPILALSTLTTLPSFLSLYGLSGDQKQAIASSNDTPSKAVIVIFTSQEQACLDILKATKQLAGTNVFTHSDSEEKKSEGGILVVGLNANDVVGTGKCKGFEVVNDSTPAFYNVLNPSIQKVAAAVKKEYPNLVMGIVECTEVSAYTDTLRAELDVPIVDPIIMATNLMSSFLDHDYQQLGQNERQKYIDYALSYPIKPTESIYRYVAMILLFVDHETKKYPRLLRPLRMKYNKFISSSLSGDDAKKEFLAAVRKLEKLSLRKKMISSKKMIHKKRFWAAMEYIIENTDPEKIKEIIQKVIENEDHLKMEKEFKQSIIEVVS